MEVCLGPRPPARRGPYGHPLHLGGLLHLQATEEAQFHDLGEIGVPLGETPQR